eukprot:TRINITY_DN12301_c0_g1_i1.p1 TRINITY_DN12301_c0_g1~~TRINITY_DN12301_c0_g1_i1.p1  ORF type:complete len:351 (+),score=69.58 TRINITY_DN12301_c0_g1_i1:50-1102(+)
MTNQVVRVALCGTGRIGTVHYNNIAGNPRVEVVAVIDVAQSAAQDYADRAGAKAYTSLLDAINDTSNPFDGVLVCTPTPTHIEVVRTSLEHGYNTFCEKPISLNIEESDEMYELAKKKGVHLLCAFQRRYDPSFMKLHKMVQDGAIGQLQKVRTISRDNPVPSIPYLSTSGGIFHDCASHDIDLLRWIIGEEPIEVYCYGTNFIPAIADIDDVDNVECMLLWENGIIGSIDISRKAVYGYDQRITCLGDAGMVTANNKKDTTVELATESGFQEDPNCYSFPTRYPVAYDDEISHFVDLLSGVTDTPVIKYLDVHNNATIADALEHSCRTGSPVTLSKDSNGFLYTFKSKF